MADFNLVMPKLGESVQEATIIRWMVKPGDVIEEDAVLLEIATDKVDSEIPSPVAGKVLKVLFEENALVPVGEIIAVINTEGTGEVEQAPEDEKPAKAAQPATGNSKTTQPADGANVNEQESNGQDKSKAGTQKEKVKAPAPEKKNADPEGKAKPKVAEKPEGNEKDTDRESGKFYSPLVMSIAMKEKISNTELDSIKGSGENGRVQKQDVLKYLENRGKQQPSEEKETGTKTESAGNIEPPRVNISLQPGDEIVQMDRMRKLIAEHMVMSKRTSPHVTNFVEADVTNLVLWRDKIKDDFLKKERTKMTFMPAFIEASAKALRQYPGVNASVDGDKIILRKNVNIGIAVALQSGNLIVPVLKNADQKSLVGIAVELNRLSDAARNNHLSPDDIQGGTFTISNFGTFRNLTGTPVINQPQAAILATGNIEKKPAVIETPTGDVIAIRHKMILSISYDHRIVDGALAGMFLRQIADLLEEFDINRQV